MTILPWFERNMKFGFPVEMLPFFLDRLEGTSLRIAAKVKAIPNDVLTLQPEGKWSVKQHIGHLGEVDDITILRLKEISEQVDTLSSAVFEPKHDFNAQSIQEVCAFFDDSRVRMIKAIKSLDQKILTKSSRHPRLNVQMTPVDLAWFDAEHDDHHLVKISQIISQF
ncbi:MAG: DinB family protein [Flammeovirgaceae bacterium]|nr:DinB family protein [Flammeovirgaceae bacterium]